MVVGLLLVFVLRGFTGFGIFLWELPKQRFENSGWSSGGGGDGQKRVGALEGWQIRFTHSSLGNVGPPN